ncbi:MAG: VCBS repeat-containing protein, partial [archaeon]
MGKMRIRVAIVLLMLLFGMLSNIEIALAVSWAHLSSADGDIPTPDSGNEQTASLVFDFDKDGDNDFLITDRSSGPAITLYRQSGTGWTKYIVDNTENLHIEAGGAYFDIDKDGDFDILMAGDWASNQVWWWENPYPNYNPSVNWNRYTIKNNGLSYQHDQAFGDFDGDGKTELAWWGRSSTDSSLYVAEIPSNPKNAGLWDYSAVNTINPSDPKLYPREGMKAIDIDLDGKLDILGGGGWFKSAGSSYAFQSIEIERSGVESRADAGQLIPGGRPEVVFSAGDFEGILAWYEWNG